MFERIELGTRIKTVEQYLKQRPEQFPDVKVAVRQGVSPEILTLLFEERCLNERIKGMLDVIKKLSKYQKFSDDGLSEIFTDLETAIYRIFEIWILLNTKLKW
jgi:hypothetical protein